MNLQSSISTENNQLTTTSIKVAEAFGRQHKNVLKSLESLDCSQEFSSANFLANAQKITIGNGASRESKIYEMTKDGFMLLVMGFTGKKATQIKEAYINAFNAMAKKLESNSQHPQTFSVEEMTPSDRSISFNRHECTPITSADGRHWLAAHQLNSLLGYKRRDVAAMLYGKNAEKFEPSQVARISYETRTRTERVLAFEASAWAQIASYSQYANMSEFIRMAHEFATDRISMPKEEWDQIKHHASKGEEQYRRIAKASSDLASTIGEGQMTFGISKILTQKH
jgi:Rha family phage regulatory protein